MVTVLVNTPDYAQAAQADVKKLNQQHQQTQLDIQQQRLHNELARLRLEYAQLESDIEKLTRAPVIADKSQSLGNTLISEVRVADQQLRIYQSEQILRWHIEQLDEGDY